MSRLLSKIRKSGETIRAVAKSANVHPASLSNYLHRRLHRVSKDDKKLIRKYFVAQGWIAQPKPRPTHACPECGKIHVESRRHNGKQATQMRAAGQSLNAEKKSATVSQ